MIEASLKLCFSNKEKINFKNEVLIIIKRFTYLKTEQQNQRISQLLVLSLKDLNRQVGDRLKPGARNSSLQRGCWQPSAVGAFCRFAQVHQQALGRDERHLGFKLVI